jgi:hypothetical protein
MPAIAAVLLLALLARYIFTQGSRGGGAVATPTSPAAVLPPNLDIKSIAVFGNEAEWAVGATVPDPACRSGGCGIGPTPHPYMQPVMLFLQAGHWEKLLTLPALHRPDYNWELNSIALVSPTEGWAVGNTVFPPGVDGFSSGILLHDIDGQWTIANLGLGSQLVAVAMRGPSDGWIAGQDINGNPLILHYDGSTWKPVVAAAFAGVRVSAIATPGTRDVWMIGADYSYASGPDGNAPSVILHCDGTAWSRQTNPSPHTWLSGLAMISPTEGWAVGAQQYATPSGASGSNPANARILHYHDGVWQQQASFTAPAGVGFFTLNAIAMSSADDGWAAGTGGMLVHYTGGHWSLVSSPTTHDLNAIALPPGGSGWAMGSPTTLLQLTGDRWSTDLTTPTTP